MNGLKLPPPVDKEAAGSLSNKTSINNTNGEDGISK